MKKKVCVFTGTRAEYGLLYWLMKAFESHPNFELQVVASGAHLSPEFGLTYQQIEDDGFKIDDQVEMLLSSDTPVGTAKSIGLGVIGFADSFSRLAPDYLIILGDRYEALAAAQTAMILRIPVVHLSGGEVTQGAYDDAIRHAITKLSYLHFTANETYRKRVIQLGEDPSRVFSVGAIGLDHLQNTTLQTVSELSDSLGFSLVENKFFLVTYHPVTLDQTEHPMESFNALLDALDHYPEYKVILTYPNADDGGRQIIPLLERYAKENHERVLGIRSLGQLRYLSATKYASAVIGNSSSGIAEVPSFRVPTVNIGSRQKGRLMADSIVHCDPNMRDIIRGIDSSLSNSHYCRGEALNNPYGSGNTSHKIVDALLNDSASSVKEFFDI